VNDPEKHFATAAALDARRQRWSSSEAKEANFVVIARRNRDEVIGIDTILHCWSLHILT